jgi:hypothetical protein
LAASPGKHRRRETVTRAVARVELPVLISNNRSTIALAKDNAVEKHRLEAAQTIDHAATKIRQEEIEQLIGFFGRSVSGPAPPA